VEVYRSESVWKVYSHTKPDTCPECNAQDSLRFFSYDPEYSPTLSAEIFRCERCETWLDVLRPRGIHNVLKLQRFLDSLRGGKVAL